METNAVRARRRFTLGDVEAVLGGVTLWEADLSTLVESFGAADLMSDVLRLSTKGMLLITGLTGQQVVRTAAVAELCGVVFVRGKRPADDVIEVARELGIPLLATERTMFETCGLLYLAACRE